MFGSKHKNNLQFNIISNYEAPMFENLSIQIFGMIDTLFSEFSTINAYQARYYGSRHSLK
jgi:hypothetical protein